MSKNLELYINGKGYDGGTGFVVNKKNKALTHGLKDDGEVKQSAKEEDIKLFRYTPRPDATENDIDQFYNT